MTQQRKKKKQIKSSSTAAVHTRLPHWIKWIIPCFGFLLYVNTIGHDYTQDDAIVITENQYTQDGVSGIPGLLTKDTFFGFFKVEGKSNLVSGGRYRPLTPIMFAIEYQIFGNKPWVGHFINALLYGFTGWVLFMFLSRLLPHTKVSPYAEMIALATTLIWLAHPLHTEVVANIKGRDEMMSFLFSMLALRKAFDFSKHNHIVSALWSGVFLFLALMSKENAITYLAIIPLTLFLVNDINKRTIVKSLIAPGIATIIFLAIRTAILGLDFGQAPAEILNNPFLKIVNNTYVPFSLDEKLATIIFTLGKYVQLFLFPHPLTHDYYPRHIQIMSFSDWRVIVSVLLYFALIFIGVRAMMRKSLIGYSILFFLITLSIVSNLIFPIGTNMSERFMYMPSFGLALCVGIGISAFSSQVGRQIGLIGLVLIVLALSVKTVLRNNVWKNNYTLFMTDIQTSTKSAKLLNSVGGELITQSVQVQDPAEQEEMNREAQVYLKKALEIHPNYKLAYLLLGNSHFYLKEYEQAIEMFRHTLRLDPQYGDGRRNLGVALRDGGKYIGESLNNPQGALQYLLEAEQYLPDDSETKRLIGVCYGRLGNAQKAIEYFEKELILAPNNASAYFNLAISFQNAGNLLKAQEYFDKAKSIDPEILNRNR